MAVFPLQTPSINFSSIKKKGKENGRKDTRGRQDLPLLMPQIQPPFPKKGGGGEKKKKRGKEEEAQTWLLLTKLRKSSVGEKGKRE